MITAQCQESESVVECCSGCGHVNWEERMPREWAHNGEFEVSCSNIYKWNQYSNTLIYSMNREQKVCMLCVVALVLHDDGPIMGSVRSFIFCVAMMPSCWFKASVWRPRVISVTWRYRSSFGNNLAIKLLYNVTWRHHGLDACIILNNNSWPFWVQ